jgi:hypothetical protein
MCCYHPPVLLHPSLESHDTGRPIVVAVWVRELLWIDGNRWMAVVDDIGERKGDGLLKNIGDDRVDSIVDERNSQLSTKIPYSTGD